MAKIPRIQFKRTKSPGVKPSKDILAEGELAINLADRMLFTKSGEEIIDLGFAKGGTVNGDIIQETGNFITNGVLTVQSPINPGINFLKSDTNEYLRLETKNNEGLFIFGDGGQTKAFVKLPKETGTIATREWTNSNKVDKKGDTLTGELRWTNKSPETYTQFIESTAVNDSTAKNFIRKFRNRSGGYLWHEVVDENGLSYYTGTTIDQLRVQLGISGVKIDGGASYEFNGSVRKAGIDAIVDQGSWSTWRDRPALVQMRCQSNNGSSSLFKILSNTGKPIAAFGGFSTTGDETQSRFQFRFANNTLDYYNGGMSIDGEIVAKGQINVKDKQGGTPYTQISYESNEARWSVNDGSWKILRHPKTTGTAATQEWANSNFYNKTDSDNRHVLLGTGGNIRLHSYKSGGHGYSSWYENNARQAYIGFGNDGSTEFTINNEKGSNSTINLKAGNVLVNSATVATQNWSNSNHYKKTETYNKSEIDGKVNGRLTQSQADGRYVRMDLTNLGKQYTPAETIASGNWGRPIGFSTMTHPNTPNKPAGITGYGYWHVIAGRDQGNGYAGFFTEYSGGRVFYGRGETGGANPTWSKVYTEASKPTPGEIGAYTKGETYSRAEVDSRVNGRLTQATADGRYAYKGGATGQNFGANIVDAADVNIRSDISVKSNLVYIKNALDLLKPLSGYKYDLRLNDNTHKNSVGIIAQDVQKVLPELVQKDSTDLLSVNYNGLTAVLINAVNELNNRLKELEVKNGSNRT
ncbi:long tail fiber distal subunit [Proteus phage vB_PmiM_Pm5461]|uniref:Long tail fiber protein Gp37 n=1 Tax=Proteus phage vB_PmiM_Pm5461 TaxID=1636250 RepID=A0A0G2SSS0_9CAUD|nr:long tail fiber protein distal subunit [Proteus phage vB_PmiM_Pm5461]AKA62102.1 long tail fiber distal subunit [Proteus phage vB_PmiM_Pm5461]